MEPRDDVTGPNESGIDISVKLFVKNPTDRPGTPPHPLRVSVSDCVSSLKEKIAKEYPGQPSVDRQRLIFSGKLLANDTTVATILNGFDLTQPQTLHLVISGESESGKRSKLEGRSLPSAAGGERGAEGRSEPIGAAAPPTFSGGHPEGQGHHSPNVGVGAAVPPFAYPLGIPHVPGAPSLPGPFPGAPHMYGTHGPFASGPYVPPYYYPGGPGIPIPPPPDDGVSGNDHGPGPAPNGGAGIRPHGQPHPNMFGPYGNLAIDPAYAAHLEAMRERFEHDLAAQQQHFVARDDANQGGGFGIAVHAVNVDGAPGNAGVGANAFRNGRNANAPHVRHYAFQFELNWSLISKLVFVVVLLSQEGSSQRVYALAAAAVAVYLWQTGRLSVLRRVVGGFVPTPTQLFDMVAPAAPEGDARQPVSRSVIALSYAYSFFYGLFCSLLPSWEPVPLPHLRVDGTRNAERSEERRDHGGNQEPNRQDDPGEIGQRNVN